MVHLQDPVQETQESPEENEQQPDSLPVDLTTLEENDQQLPQQQGASVQQQPQPVQQQPQQQPPPVRLQWQPALPGHSRSQPARSRSPRGGHPGNRWRYSGTSGFFTRTWTRTYDDWWFNNDRQQWVPVKWTCVSVQPDILNDQVTEMWRWRYT